MNKIKLGKRGGVKYLSPWWLLILVIIGLGIVGGVIIFYSKSIDVKTLEAEILVSRIVTCLGGNGKLNENLLEKNFDIYSECRLNKEILSDNEHYFEVEVLKDGKQAREIIKTGNSDFKTQCAYIEEGGRAKHFAGCSETSLFAEGYEIKIFAGSNQLGIKERKNA